MAELPGFIHVGGSLVAVSEIAAVHPTQYYNGGQTKRTTITLKSGKDISTGQMADYEVARLIEQAIDE
jgi:hypothetical protein